MLLNSRMGGIAKRIVACALASLSCSFSAAAIAAMKLDQMNSLSGAAQLGITADQLFRRCGLPAAIVDHGAAADKKWLIRWHDAAMRLSAMDWDAAYGKRQRSAAKGWINDSGFDRRCAAGVKALKFHAKGHVGVITITKKAGGFGYVTAYREPKDLYRAHKVVAVEARLARSLPLSVLLGRYGAPDEVLKQARDKEDYRYWVLALRGGEPESLYAVDFEVDKGRWRGFVISTAGTDFVQQRLDVLVRRWERDHIVD